MKDNPSIQDALPFLPEGYRVVSYAKGVPGLFVYGTYPGWRVETLLSLPARLRIRIKQWKPTVDYCS